MKHLKQFLLMAMLLFTLAPMQVSAKENIDVKEILWGHIKDSYEWHITQVGDYPVVINLPVIVHTTTGWHVFSSGEFSEERDANGDRPGPYNLVIKNGDAQNNPNKIVEKVNGEEVLPLDISITKTTCVLFIDAIILLLCVLIPASWCKKHKIDDPAPKGFVGLMHMFIMSVVANIMGIVPFPPGGGNLTGNIACTCFLGVTTFIITNVTGTKDYWKEIFWPDVPTWLKVPVPLMPFIELFGIFTKPLALIIRLFANMMAGHAIALSFAAIIFIMFNISENAIANYVAGTGMTIVSVAMSAFMMLLEVLVSYIQALVFTMLSAVFISQAHVHEHEPEIAK